jgi:citrate lyase subunit beta/citryl-CoA lyase
MKSKLFIQGDRPEQYPAARQAGAGLLSIDLEDTVAPSRKDAARAGLAPLGAAMSPGERTRAVVRVNALDTGRCEDDMEAAVAAGFTWVNVPKMEAPAQVEAVAHRLALSEAAHGLAAGTVRIMANIETPAGLRRAVQIASASPRVNALQVGYADMLEPHGMDRMDETLIRHIQAMLRFAAAEAGVMAFDGVFARPVERDFFLREVVAARRLGFTGKTCLDAAQVELVNREFTPTAHQVTQARRVVESARKQAQAGVGLFEVDGRFYDEPFVQGARRVLESAGMPVD